MFINEVTHIVGLSKKSIRYYEANGLITPKRNSQNDYRIYDDATIKQLKIIKFLRELDVPINDLKKLQNNTLTLKECLTDRITKINQEQQNFFKVKNMCQDIIAKNITYTDFDPTGYTETMTILNKEGFTMRNTKTNKIKKILGAMLSATIFLLFISSILSLIIYFQTTASEKMPVIFFLLIVSILIIFILATIYNLITRIKEIKKGEEDEASKY